MIGKSIAGCHNRPTRLLLYLLVTILFAVMVVWLNLSWRPDVSQLPADSGFYAYFGRAILHGQLPYRDLWDNKPPLGLYLNALGQLVFGQTPWGVWWSSVLWITGCGLLCFLVIRKVFGSPTALLSSVLFIIVLMDAQIFQGGNLTEIYALAPQLAIVGVTYLFINHGRKARFVLLAGVLTACAFLIKQPTITLGIASIIVIIASTLGRLKVRETVKLLLVFGIGFFFPLGLVALYWLSRGAWGEFLDGAYRQGFSSIGGSQSDFRKYFKLVLSEVLPGLYLGQLFLLAALTGGVFLLGKLYRHWLKLVFRAGLSWLYLPVLVGLVIVPIVARRAWPSPYSFVFWVISLTLASFLLWLRFHRLSSKPAIEQVISPMEWTWLVALLALPVEAFMASLGGRYFGHYFIPMIPSIVVTLAYPIWRVISVLSAHKRSFRSLLANSAYALLAVGTLVWGGFTFARDIPSPEVTKNIAGIFYPRIQLNEIQDYIVQTTLPDDTVLVWHIHLGINFITRRFAPSRILYPLNLFIPPNPSNTKLAEFVDELEARPPELILVQKVSSIGLPFVNQPLDNLCHPTCASDFYQAIAIPSIRQEWLRLQKYFEGHYTADAEIYDWIVYRKLP